MSRERLVRGTQDACTQVGGGGGQVDAHAPSLPYLRTRPLPRSTRKAARHRSRAPVLSSGVARFPATPTPGAFPHSAPARAQVRAASRGPAAAAGSLAGSPAGSSAGSMAVGPEATAATPGRVRWAPGEPAVVHRPPVPRSRLGGGAWHLRCVRLSGSCFWRLRSGLRSSCGPGAHRALWSATAANGAERRPCVALRPADRSGRPVR